MVLVTVMAMLMLVVVVARLVLQDAMKNVVQP